MYRIVPIYLLFLKRHRRVVHGLVYVYQGTAIIMFFEKMKRVPLIEFTEQYCTADIQNKTKPLL
jgi:hypothetical protein